MLDHTDSNNADGRGGSALRDALRRARVEAAEQTDVVVDLRHAEIARLEVLRDELAPILAEVPPEIDLFDVGLVPGDRPRLFIDMVSFIEMGRDRRLYRFMRDGRHGRVCAVESEKSGPIVEAVTDYVARRLVERERLLADDDRLGLAPPASRSRRSDPPESEPSRARPTQPTSAEEPAPPSAARLAAPAAGAGDTKPRRGFVRALTILAAFGAGGALGALVVAGLLVAAAKGFLPI